MRTALKIIGTMAFVLGLGLGTTSNASADSFDDAAKAAKPIHSANSMAALFWSQDADCGKMKSDLLQRQCEGVRHARAGSISEQTFVVDVAGPAIEIKNNAKKNAVEVTLRACISCGSEGPIIMGKGAHQITDGEWMAAPIKSVGKSFKDAANAEHWSKYIATRLRAQLLVKVPEKVERFKAAGREGYKVEVVGYRLYDPCQGNVMGANPASKRGPVNASVCKDEPALTPKVGAQSGKPAEVEPDRLNTSQIKSAMNEATKLTDRCHQAYGIDGTAVFKLTIAGSGKLVKAEQEGDFKGTPTGICLVKALETVTFPKSKKKETQITYPIMLQ